MNHKVIPGWLTDLEENREYRVRMMATFKGDSPGVHDESWPWSYIRTGTWRRGCVGRPHQQDDDDDDDNNDDEGW